jgi:hypothetical protein
MSSSSGALMFVQFECNERQTYGLCAHGLTLDRIQPTFRKWRAVNAFVSEFVKRLLLSVDGRLTSSLKEPVAL